MELSPKQQIAELVKNNQRILLVGHKNHGGDLLGSMLALESVLTSQGKSVSMVVSETISESLLFLPGIEKIQPDVSARDLIVQINKKKNDIEKVSYNDDNDLLNIIISPKSKALSGKDLKIIEGDFNYDLIIVLDTPDVEKIDNIYDKYTELFFEVPIINIDHHSGNEYFGTVNLVDLTATSTAEILVSIIEAMGPNHFDADVATCLLTGLIADTGSFKNTNTTPKSLTISAQMLAAGARQQEIIQNLYKTRPLQILKLWGKVLSNINYSSEYRLVTSFVNERDLENANAAPGAVVSVLDELLASAPGTDIVLVLVEEKGRVYGYLKGLNGQDVLSIAEKFNGHGNTLMASFIVPNATLEKNAKGIINQVKEFRNKQLGRVNAAPVVPKNIEKVVEPLVKTDLVDSTLEEVDHSRDVVQPKPELEQDNPVVPDLENQTNPISNVGAVQIPDYDEIFLDHKVEETVASVEPLVTTNNNDDIEQALQSIDYEIETGGKNSDNIVATPNIDVEGVRDKSESLRKLGEVMRGYNPGKALEEKGNQPIDQKVWK